MKLSAVLMNSAHIFEVLLRNRIDAALREDLSPHWMLELCQAAEAYKADPQNQHDSHLFFLPYGPKDSIVLAALRAKTDAIKNGIQNVDQDALVASASFGYWLTLLGRRYEATLWRQSLRHAFPQSRRLDLFEQVEAIQAIRNRIAHYEPLIFARKKHDVHSWKAISNHLYAVRAAIRRIDPDAFLAVEPLLDCSHVVRDLAEPFQIDLSRVHTGRLPRFARHFPYVLIECDAFNQPVYCKRSKASSLLWTQLYPNRTVQFLVAFRPDGRPYAEALLDVLPASEPASSPATTSQTNTKGTDHTIEPATA